ncbi:MAG TPA: histidine kinase [Ensifer sp.]|nr:histidine kinase [Ensifer sp.]
MKTLLAATAALFLATTAVYAGEVQIPSNRPIISANVPDDWTTNETNTGIEINSADNSVYLAIDIASPKKTGDMIDEAAKFLDSQGVTIDEKTQKYTEDKLNGKDIIYIEWAGKDKDGPASVGLAALVLNEKTVAVLTYWGTPGEEEKNSAAVGKILASIKSAE